MPSLPAVSQDLDSRSSPASTVPVSEPTAFRVVLKFEALLMLSPMRRLSTYSASPDSTAGLARPTIICSSSTPAATTPAMAATAAAQPATTGPPPPSEAARDTPSSLTAPLATDAAAPRFRTPFTTVDMRGSMPASLSAKLPRAPPPGSADLRDFICCSRFFMVSCSRSSAASAL